VRSVVVTGASTGIGRATALQLDAAGWRVFAGVRRDEDAEALRRAGSERLLPLQLDITEAGQIAEAREQIAETVGPQGLDGLVNNAGIAIISPVETIPIDDFRRQVEVNLTGQVAVTQALLPQVRAARGRIVFISSIGGRISYPYGAAYHASKYGLEAVSDCLRQEVRRWGIDVSVVEPGAIDTPIWERGEKIIDDLASNAPEAYDYYADGIDRMLSSGKKVLKARGTSPEKVAETIARALTAKRPRNRYLVGFDAHLQVRAHQLVPARAYDWIVAKAVKA
jgi:NAD(P)-dependent dehydrogenase (short-subunit alcohol dehydrogenase family)